VVFAAGRDFLSAESMLLLGSSAEKISLPLTRLSPFCERGLPAKLQFIFLNLRFVSLIILTQTERNFNIHFSQQNVADIATSHAIFLIY
jgi:hypothetical protein